MPVIIKGSEQKTGKIDMQEHNEQHMKNLLHAVNNAAVTLLTTDMEEGFEESLVSSMAPIGDCLDVDRMMIWRN